MSRDAILCPKPPAISSATACARGWSEAFPIHTLSHTVDVFFRDIELLDEAGQLTLDLGIKPLIHRVNDKGEQIDAGASPISYCRYGLNQRETEVLRLIAAGESNREIGGELFVTPNTVARPVSSIFLKIASSNRVEATFSATQTGLA